MVNGIKFAGQKIDLGPIQETLSFTSVSSIRKEIFPTFKEFIKGVPRIVNHEATCLRLLGHPDLLTTIGFKTEVWKIV